MKRYIFLLLILTVLITSCSVDTTEEPLYLGMMVHIEGWDTENIYQDEYETHKEAVEAFADIFDEHNAKATFEASPEFILAGINFDDNFLLELYERGHGIGVHADVGGQGGLNDEYYNFMVNNIEEMKYNLEELTGLEIRHVSGICSNVDWVTAAIESGYEFTTGGVAHCVMSMPEEDRPEEFKDCEGAGACHDSFPTELEDRMNPWRMESGENWVEHSSIGELVMLASSSVFYSLEEEATGELSEGAKGTLEDGDVDEFFNQLDQALEFRDPNQINIYYSAWSIGNKLRVTENDDLFNDFFERLQPYIDSGQVEWKTLPEMYDLYLEWEQS
tara:strand:+ start:939 stop:1934 length:996 start_codon:yes stop_codon:yes gene_type:complete